MRSEIDHHGVETGVSECHWVTGPAACSGPEDQRCCVANMVAEAAWIHVNGCIYACSVISYHTVNEALTSDVVDISCQKVNGE